MEVLSCYAEGDLSHNHILHCCAGVGNLGAHVLLKIWRGWQSSTAISILLKLSRKWIVSRGRLPILKGTHIHKADPPHMQDMNPFTILLPAESYYKQLLSHSKSCLFKKNILWLTSICSTLKPLFSWVAKCTLWAFAFFYQICRVILFNWCEIVINMKIYWRKTSLHYHYLIFSLLRVRCLLLISWLCLEVEL